MVGAKTRASLTSELRRLLPRRGRRGLQTTEWLYVKLPCPSVPYLLLEGACRRECCTQWRKN